MTEFYDCPVENNEYWLAKDLATRIYNVDRKRYPKMSSKKYELKLKQTVKTRYNKEKDTKSLIEILREYYKEVQEKED